MTEEPTARACPWCSAAAGPSAIRCAACGAALAQREDLDGLVLPGVTAVHPALQDAAGRPMRMPGPSPTQGAAPALVAGLVIGGPVGIAAVGGVAALGAAEYLGVGGGRGASPADPIGEAGESARAVAERLEAEEAAALQASAASADDPQAVVDGSAGNSDNSARD